MTRDQYDLVIIGASQAGVQAARQGIALGGRVALVTQGIEPIAGLTLAQVGRILAEIGTVDRRSTYWHGTTAAPLSWAEILAWTQRVVTNLRAVDAPAVLAALGVDVVMGMGEFLPQARPVLAVADRPLMASAYLVAMPARPQIPAIPGLTPSACLTVDDPCTLTEQPQKVAIVGDGPIGLQLAQGLVRLGTSVTVVTDAPHLLPGEDREATRLLQAQLEVEGVRILTGQPIDQVRSLAGAQEIQVGGQTIQAELLLVDGGYRLNLDSLNLPAVGVVQDQQGLRLNRKLQTSQPRIYVCRDDRAGYPVPQMALEQTTIVVRNALFWPIARFDPTGIPRIVPTDPELAAVGLTEPEAQQRYGKDLLVVQQSLHALEQAQFSGDTTGFGKLLLRRNGTLVGAQIVGTGASDLIGPIALALRQRSKLGTIATGAVISQRSDLLRQLVLEGQRLQGLHRPWWSRLMTSH
ncbi:hypothetical protein BST81_16300 [Leptolyngbya sp. 'hensonii']|uniref:FAD-dependent oxidoreductase n=1 Tax=Leptolyngbya sp. 'hensonii' TaxID=1922337 RepID=UPI00094FA987|nr:NAD(P)/FAD-dependent oxidoreductase [Leptolyngbya sp. 'hensonii']OLP17360.1 hypothetical protein BST81_16300 [Leptolyngbya sp. 'hensonii']